MLILSQNTDDKSTQLEQFTSAVLKTLGYVNITTNEVRSGAEELDLTGEHHIPVPGAPARISRLVAECKAYMQPIDISVWHKFLGKLITEEAKTRQDAYGCLIALSGANGECSSAYRDFRVHSDRVSLLASDDLARLLRDMYLMVDEKDVSRFVSERTTRTVVKMDIAYYGGAAYWYVRFSNDTFTLICGDCRAIDSQLAATLGAMIVASIGGTFFDLSAEVNAIVETVQARATTIAMLLMSNSHVTLPDLIAKAESHEGHLRTAVTQLATEGVLKLIGNTISIDSTADPANIIRIVLMGMVPCELLSSKGYMSLCDNRLLDSVIKIQGGIQLNEEQLKKATFLLKISPSAARAAVTPMEMITNHRNAGLEQTEAINEMDCEFFLETLCERFQHDFRVQQLSDFYLHTAGIIEAAETTTLVLKSRKQVLFTHQIKNRTQKGEWHEPDATGKHRVISIRCMNNLPEPWQPQPKDEKKVVPLQPF